MTIRDAAKRVIELQRDYTGGKVGEREMLLDPILYAYLEGRFGHFTRQHPVRRTGTVKPARVDFRRGTMNPVLIEFAVRPPSGHGTLYGSQNRSELRKLCRMAAALRVLLLVDLYHIPLSQESLRRSYEKISGGQGNFVRRAVRVVYVHRKRTFDFLWRP